MVSYSTSLSLQASLILPRDFSLYVNWQLKYSSGSDVGLVSDAVEYYRFIRYRDALVQCQVPSSALFTLLSPTPSPPDHKHRIASLCGHTTHPSDPLLAEFCPVCEVIAHLSLLHAVTEAWDKAGGPRLRPGSPNWGKSYGRIRSSWHTARLKSQQFLGLLDVLLEYEKAWELKHPLRIQAAQTTNGASAALKLAIEQSRYPAMLSPVPPTPKKGKLLSKKVTFSPDVQIKHNDYISTSATKFIRDRLRDKFDRSSLTYEPGEHACGRDSEFLDTSVTKTEPGDVRNLKIFIIDDEEAFNNLQKEPQAFRDYVGEYQGLVGMHTLKRGIFDFLVNYIKHGPLARDDMESPLSEADRMTVLVDQEMSGVVDVFLFDGSDENKDDQRPSKKGKKLGSKDWTCLKECLSLPQPII